MGLSVPTERAGKCKTNLALDAKDDRPRARIEEKGRIHCQSFAANSHQRGVTTSTSTVSPFPEWFEITFQNNGYWLTGMSAWTLVARGRRIGLTDPTKLAFIDEAACVTSLARLRGWIPQNIRIHWSSNFAAASAWTPALERIPATR